MRVLAMIKRILVQMIRDKRTLALMFLAPLLILTLMYFLFNSDASNPTLGVVNVDETIVTLLRDNDNDIDVKAYTSVDDNTMVDDNLGGLLEIKDGSFNLKLQNEYFYKPSPLANFK